MDCLDLSAMLFFGFLDIIQRLKVHPKLRTSIQKSTNLDSSLSRDFPLASDNLSPE
jgi:hypothetical protein